MQKRDYRHSFRGASVWTRFRHRLVYLPGAMVMLYGFWLSLNA